MENKQLHYPLRKPVIRDFLNMESQEIAKISEINQTIWWAVQLSGQDKDKFESMEIDEFKQYAETINGFLSIAEKPKEPQLPLATSATGASAT